MNYLDATKNLISIVVLSSLSYGTVASTRLLATTYASEKSSQTPLKPLKVKADPTDLIEDRIENFLRRANYDDPNNIVPKLLKEKSKFRQMAKTCLAPDSLKDHVDLSIDRNGVGELILRKQIETGVYLLILLCTTSGRSVNSLRLFTYTDSGGINLEPIKLRTLWKDKSEKLRSVETTNLFAKGIYIDTENKKLTITTGCNVADGWTDSSAVYEYEKQKFILNEFWQNVGTCEEIEMKRFYSRLN